MTDTTAPAIITCPQCGTRNRVPPSADGTPRCARCHHDLPWVVNADEGDFEAQINVGVPTLVDFWAPWCGPCRQVSPVLENLAGRYAGRLKLIKVNVDDNPGLAQRYNAMSIPLLVILRRGQEIDRQVGAAPQQQLQSWVERAITARA